MRVNLGVPFASTQQFHKGSEKAGNVFAFDLGNWSLTSRVSSGKGFTQGLTIKYLGEVIPSAWTYKKVSGSKGVWQSLLYVLKGKT